MERWPQDTKREGGREGEEGGGGGGERGRDDSKDSREILAEALEETGQKNEKLGQEAPMDDEGDLIWRGGVGS